MADKPWYPATEVWTRYRRAARLLGMDTGDLWRTMGGDDAAPENWKILEARLVSTFGEAYKKKEYHRQRRRVNGLRSRDVELSKLRYFAYKEHDKQYTKVYLDAHQEEMKQ